MEIKFNSPISADDVPGLIGKVRRECSVKEKAKKYNGLLSHVSGILFAVFALCMVFSLFCISDDFKMKILENLPWLDSVVSFMHTNFVLRPDTSNLVRFLICAAFVILPSVIFSLLFKQICRIFLHRFAKKVNVGDVDPASADIFELQNEDEKLKKISKDCDSSLNGLWTSFVITIFIVVLKMYKSSVVDGGESTSDFASLGSIIGVVILWLVVAFVMVVFLTFAPHFSPKKAENDSFFSAVDDACKKEEKRRQKELEEEEAERERAEKAERKKRGEALYQKAVSGDEIDEKLMLEAADLGEPNACLYVGKGMVSDVEGYTTKEIKEIHERAKPYLCTAYEAGIPVGVLLYCASVVMTEKLGRERVYEMLNELRSLDKNKLPEEFNEAYTITLQSLVDMANKCDEDDEWYESRKNTVVMGSEDYKRIHSKAMERLYPKEVTGWRDSRNGQTVYSQYDGSKIKYVNESGEEVPSSEFDWGD